MSASAADDGAARFAQPPSLVDTAAEALRRMIIGGDLMPGDRVVENQLTKEFGISRPPLREALRVLEREGLVRQLPRKGAIVTPLTLHDVYEIFTLRWEYERLALRLAIPVTDSPRLARVHAALDAMRRAAEAGDEAEYGRQSFEFHLSFVALSGHRRLEDAYRSLQLQMQLCMAMNRRARVDEDLRQDVARHVRLVELVESGDRKAVERELSRHGDRTFLEGIERRLGGHTEVALAWLKEVRGTGDGR
ncbi:MAG TPA: GntR family transcriptional regulator [Nocardioidaceae bacterium]